MKWASIPYYVSSSLTRQAIPNANNMSEKYLNWEIEECIDILTKRAKELGDKHNYIMTASCERKGQVWQGAPDAYQATTYWHAIEIIRELQVEIAQLKGNKCQ